MRIDGEAHQRSEREVGPLRPKSQKIAAQRQISARQLSGMSGIFLRTGRDLQRLHWLAGAGGLEPPNGGIKNRPSKLISLRISPDRGEKRTWSSKEVQPESRLSN